ncbi:MAG: hypothetical protein ACYTG5_03920 [Planctomycetota bacterium]
MKSALKMTADNKIPRVVRELSERYGGQLAGEPVFWDESTPEGRFAYLEVVPLINSGGERLALSLGHFLWRGLETKDQLAGLVVQCRWVSGRIERFQVRPPRRAGRPIRRLAEGEVPSPLIVSLPAPGLETRGKGKQVAPPAVDPTAKKGKKPEPVKAKTP